MNKSKIKICGIKKINTLKSCIENKIDFFGLIFYKKSPRFIKYDQAIRLINYSKNKKISSVGIFVDENINILNKTLKNLDIEYLQLHGTENNDYIKYTKQNNNIKIIKAISINSITDFSKTQNYGSADFFLFDYKPSKNELPGGNAKKFDWKLIQNIEIDKMWFLSGGININNINDISKYNIPYGIDISSGVEDSPGIKSNDKIKYLIKKYESK